MALVSAHPGLHNSAQMENPTKASTATLRTIIAIPPTSIMESRLVHAPIFFGSRATALIWIMCGDHHTQQPLHQRLRATLIAECR